MLINLAEIMTVKGKDKHIEAPLELSSFCMDGVEYHFTKKQFVDLNISHVGERKIWLDCKTNLSLSIPCSRCLEDVEVPFSISFQKELDFTETAEENIEQLDEMNYMEEYNLNVDKLVEEEILIQFPLRVLCSEDCKGICNDCGKNLNLESCDCNAQGKDPRMLAIQDIFKNFRQTDN